MDLMSERAEMPRRAEPESAGYDFYAPEDIVLRPGEWTDVDTGVRFDGHERALNGISYPRMDMPGFGAYIKDADFDNWVMLVFPRSGLGFRYGVRFANTVGVIDQSYRDTIKARMTSDVECTIKKGERFMQGVIVPFCTFKDEQKPLRRKREGGLGSTGQ